MKGDFSRITFDRRRHFSHVLMQQGRVQLDADFNEQASIFTHFLRTLTVDLIGRQGGPGDSFQIDPAENEDGEPIPCDFVIRHGRYYVDGILCENDTPAACPPRLFPPVRYTTQPDYPVSKEQMLAKAQRYLVYLDVWERHITYIEDDRILEVALGGPDTATRARVVWQVKAWELEKEAESNGDGSALCEEFLAKLSRPPKACLKSRAKVEKPSDDPCIIPPESRYRGPENQLYRVEIHDDSEAKNGPTFKWSRDNGSVVYPLESLQGSIATVEHLGKDDRRLLDAGDWVEIVDDGYVLRGEPGPLLKVNAIDSVTGEVTLDIPQDVSVPVYDADTRDRHPLLRRWDQQASKSAPLQDGAVPVVEGKWIDLEDGVQIYFEPDGIYRPGHFWQIPARVETGDVEWPREQREDGRTAPKGLQPRGIRHHYAPLAILSVDAEGAVSVDEDCRCTFPPLCEAQHREDDEEDRERPPDERRPREEEPRFPVERIEGVGPAFAERLKAKGIIDAAVVARMDPEELAAILSLPEGRAISTSRTAEIIENAKRLVAP